MIKAEFEDIHKTMYTNALSKFEASKSTANDFKEFMTELNNKKMILTPWCDQTSCEKKVKEMSGMLAKADETEKEMSGSAKTLCKPLEQKAVPEGTKCFAHEYCKNDAKVYCFWGRSY